MLAACYPRYPASCAGFPSRQWKSRSALPTNVSSFGSHCTVRIMGCWWIILHASQGPREGVVSNGKSKMLSKEWRIAFRYTKTVCPWAQKMGVSPELGAPSLHYSSGSLAVSFDCLYHFRLCPFCRVLRMRRHRLPLPMEWRSPSLYQCCRKDLSSSCLLLCDPKQWALHPTDSLVLYFC